MKKNLEEIIDYIENIRTKINSFIPEADEIRLGVSPTPEDWSPAEILDHLFKTEIYITDLFSRQLDRAKKKNMSVKPEGDSYLHSLDKFEVEIIKEKFNAPEISKPDGSMDPEVILQSMNRSRSNLIKLLREFSQYDMSGIEFPHPSYGRMNMIQWVLFLGKHEERHFNQIKLLIEG